MQLFRQQPLLPLAGSGRRLWGKGQRPHASASCATNGAARPLGDLPEGALLLIEFGAPIIYILEEKREIRAALSPRFSKRHAAGRLRYRGYNHHHRRGADRAAAEPPTRR